MNTFQALLTFVSIQTTWKTGQQLHYPNLLSCDSKFLLDGWLSSTSANNGYITDSSLSLFNKVDVNHYKIHCTLPPSPIAHTPSMVISAPSMVNSGMSDSQVTLLNIKKGTKRDLSAYHSFKSEKYFDTFHHAFHATTRAQGLGDILDSKFYPKHSDTSATDFW